MSVCCRTKVFGSLQEREGCNEHKDTRCVITPKPINVNTDSNIAYLQWRFCFIAWSMILFSFIYFYIIFLYVRGSILKGAFQFHYQFTSLMQGYLTCKNSWKWNNLSLETTKGKHVLQIWAWSFRDTAIIRKEVMLLRCIMGTIGLIVFEFRPKVKIYQRLLHQFWKFTFSEWPMQVPTLWKW